MLRVVAWLIDTPLHVKRQHPHTCSTSFQMTFLFRLITEHALGSPPKYFTNHETLIRQRAWPGSESVLRLALRKSPSHRHVTCMRNRAAVLGGNSKAGPAEAHSRLLAKVRAFASKTALVSSTAEVHCRRKGCTVVEERCRMNTNRLSRTSARSCPGQLGRRV